MNLRRLSIVRLHRLLGPGIAGSAAVLAISACSKPLLSPTDQRTPFDRYDAIRGNYAPQTVEDKFGQRQPNLRGRLSPKN